jgi:hypothetical protein
MTNVEPDCRGVSSLEPMKSGPEQYAPPDRRAAKLRANIDEAMVRDHNQADTTSDATNELNKRIQVAAGASMEKSTALFANLRVCAIFCGKKPIASVVKLLVLSV